MLDLLCPDQYLSSIFALDIGQLWSQGIRAIIVDLDNTLLKWGEYENNARLLAWCSDLKAAGLRLCIVSNNGGRRVLQLAGELGVPVVTNAAKPSRRAFRRAMALLQSEPSTTAMVGDQIFTDIYGGNRLGLYTVLVVPLSRKEFIWTRLVRVLERKVMARLQAEGRLAPATGRGGSKID